MIIRWSQQAWKALYPDADMKRPGWKAYFPADAILRTAPLAPNHVARVVRALNGGVAEAVVEAELPPEGLARTIDAEECAFLQGTPSLT